MTHTATLSTGVRLPYVEQGAPDGVPVVLLHGYSDTWRSYELVLPHLPDSVHAFAITQRGHGDADRPRDGYRPEDYVADVAAFLDAVGIGAAVIVGHSGGSDTAQRFAIAHPDRTLGLVVLGAFNGFRGKPLVEELWSAVVELRDPVDPAFVREFQESTVQGPVAPGYIDQAVRESLKLPARVWRAYLGGLRQSPAPVQTGRILAPTLILWPECDPFCSWEDQVAIHAAAPRAEIVVYHDTGHALHWEEPRRAAADIASFAVECRHPVAVTG